MLQPNQILQNRYRIDAVLGQGGMGAVYRVFDSRLNRTCVVKEMLIASEGQTNTADAARQFQKEAEILAGLRHANLPVVHDYFQEQGSYYLVMDLVEGQSLQNLIPPGGLPEAVVLNYADQLLETLQYIHARGIVHRDIKPANIIVQPDGRLVLVDFGLVKVIQATGGQTTTGFARGMGTPEYAPPEQSIGRTDQRSDIYSLGATLYRTLTGQAPASASERVAEEALIEPRRWQPGISAQTEQVILRAMALKKNERYVDAEAMRMALKSAHVPASQLQPAPVLPPTRVLDNPATLPISTHPVTGKPGKGRTRRAFLIGSAAIVIGGGLLAVLSRQIQPAPQAVPSTPMPTEVSTPTSVPSATARPVETKAPAPAPTQSMASILTDILSDIKVAVLAPLSGPVPTFGVSTRNGALMAFDEWNARGGINGRKLVPVVEDSQCTPDPAVNAANKVIDQDKVKYIIGEVCSKASIPVSEIANARKVIQISPTSTNTDVTVDASGKVKDYIFRACFIDSFQGLVGAKFAYGTLNARTAFIMEDQANAYVLGLAGAFEQSFTALGGKVADKENYSGSDSDFSAILAKAAAFRPDLIYLPDYYNVVNLVGRQARAKGYTTPFMGGDGWDSADLDTQATAGSYFTNHFSPYDTRPEVVNFVKAYGAMYKDNQGQPQVPDALGALAYDAANLLFTAIEKAGSDDSDKVKDALAGIAFTGASGKLTFDALHNPIKSAVIMRVANGKVSFDKTIDP